MTDPTIIFGIRRAAAGASGRLGIHHRSVGLDAWGACTMLEIDSKAALLVNSVPLAFSLPAAGSSGPRARALPAGLTCGLVVHTRVDAADRDAVPLLEQGKTAGGAVEALSDTSGTAIPHTLDGMQCG
jgi:hypothetical protein